MNYAEMKIVLRFLYFKNGGKVYHLDGMRRLVGIETPDQKDW